MNETRKDFFLRIGSNSEKQYIEKTGTLFSGLLARANYFESSPGMLSGIFLRFASLESPKGYIIDPVTYVFALNPVDKGRLRSICSLQKVDRDKADEKLRTDLRMSEKESIPFLWKKEIANPTKKQKNKVEILNIMRTYRKLADKYFVDILANEVGKRAISPTDFNDTKTIDDFVSKVIEYQRTAISSRYDAIKYEDFRSGISEPMIILSPYFIITNSEWLELMTKIWKSFDSQYKSSNGAVVIQCSIEYLKKEREALINAISNTEVNTVFIWLDDFKEENATKEDLSAYTKFIYELSLKGKNVVNLYSGGLSPFLFPFGLSGIVNNPGYGMQRAFQPVIGGLPTAKYYMPTLHTRMSVLDSYDLLQEKDIGITKENFIKDVCACPICRDTIESGIRDMIMSYGELGPEIDGRERRFPTRKALERCAYHFIFSRLIEYRWARKATREDVIAKLTEEIAKWGEDAGGHLIRWKTTLEKVGT